MRIHPQATEELNAAIGFYRARAVEIALHFAAEVEESFKRIGQYPLAYPIHTSQIHKFPMHQFPFNILYTMTDGEIVIIAIMHQRRKPDYWKDRI